MSLSFNLKSQKIGGGIDRMSEVKRVKVNSIAPNSKINVRRQGVKENVEKVKASIQEHGYWPEQAIIVRPHPNHGSEYNYENVTGQCRLKACLELGLEEIPAFIFELSDEQAIQRSWLENEMRGDLTFSDRSYWVEKIYKQYNGKGHTAKEALELAAKYLGVTVQTAMNYYTLSVLPDDLKQMVDQKILPTQIANSIVKNTYDRSRFEESQEAMRERTSWILELDRDNRKHAVGALEKLGHKASIADLSAYVNKINESNKHTVQYTIPNVLYDALLQWGQERGLEGEQTIIGYMVAEVLRQK